MQNAKEECSLLLREYTEVMKDGSKLSEGNDRTECKGETRRDEGQKTSGSGGSQRRNG